MKLLTVILLLSFGLKAQKNFDADGHIKHFYISAIISGSSSEILYKHTKLDGFSSLVGALIGISVNAGKEIVYDKYMHKGVPSLGDGIVGSFGAITGGFIHRISIDLRQKKKEQELYKLELAKKLLE